MGCIDLFWSSRKDTTYDFNWNSCNDAKLYGVYDFKLNSHHDATLYGHMISNGIAMIIWGVWIQ